MATVKQKPKGKSVAVTKRSVVAPPPLRVHDAPGEQTMHVEMMPILSVRAYGKNPRIIPQSAIEKTAKSIKEFGWRQPIVVDEQMTVIVGHTRLMAAAHLGMTHVPVHVARGLTKAQVKAYRLADNRVAQESSWEMSILGEEMIDLRLDDFDLSLTGFDGPEIDDFFPDEVGAGGEDDADLTPPAEPTTKRGDVYQLGRHRLMCGDATQAAEFAVLMAGVKAQVLWTDPPYGVSYVGKTKDALTIENDGSEGLGRLLAASFAAADTVMADGARFYVAAPAGPRGTEFRVCIAATGWAFHQALVWVKNSMVLGHSDYHYRHEDILYGWKPGQGRLGRGAHDGTRWYGDHSQTTVFEIDRPSRSEEHPTMKPLELMRQCLANSAKRGDAVLDMFAGSGSTMLAAEQVGCPAYLLEIDPRYCDVIIRRWEKVSGETAVRL